MAPAISRKQFLTLAIVTLGVGCGSDDSDEGGSGGAGTGGAGTGGSGTGGSSTGGTGTGGTATGGTGGTATGGSSGSGTGGTATGGASGGTSNACTTDLTAEIFDNHDHELHIPLADIEAGVEKTYETTGSANHCHTVTLTAADFATLKSGGSVTKHSCTGTNHQYVLGCVSPPAPSAPDCNGTPDLGACDN
jgi:hypothetical protein